MTFNEWMSATNRQLPPLQRLRDFSDSHGVNWPSEVKKEDYVAAINQSSALESDKPAALQDLDEVWPQFVQDEVVPGLLTLVTKTLKQMEAAETQSAATVKRMEAAQAENEAKIARLEEAAASAADKEQPHGFFATIASFFSSIGAWGTAVIAFVILFGLWSRMDENFIRQLSNPEVARGMIGFLFAVGTIGIAMLSVVAVFGSSSDKPLEDRFAHGKDILTILIGVFGTIVGFYFGQAAFTGNQSNQTPAVSTTSQGAEQEQASPPLEPARPEQ